MEAMPQGVSGLRIGAFARAAGVNVETIRFYQRTGLLAAPDRPAGGIRRYGPTDVSRVRFVKAAQRLGFSLGEIADLLRLEDGTHCAQARQLANLKLRQVREKLADLTRMEAALSELVLACEAVSGQVCCPLIASLHAEQASAPHPPAARSPERTHPVATPPDKLPSGTGMPGTARREKGPGRTSRR